MCRRGLKKHAATTIKKKHPRTAIYNEASQYPNKITVSHLMQIYRLTECCSTSKSHPNKFRGTNCTNPYCFLKIGLERWDKFAKGYKLEEPKRDKLRDIEMMACGLYNNANLCYLNSFLQIWFNINHFRRFVFSYKSVPNFNNLKTSSGMTVKVQKIMERLQAVFFALEISPFEAADAVRLADALFLQDQQQDVIEFHTLFFSLLEKSLEGHPSEAMFKKIQERLHFITKQVIECVCGRKQETQNTNNSLHLTPENCSSVTEMLSKECKPHQLQDYTCPDCHACGTSQMRSNVPVSLPQILIIQLNRVTSMDHRKDRTAINYPRVLNESTLMPGSKSHHKYHLHAVCVHDGNAASSGHYHDYVYDAGRAQWFHFNDANVKPVKPPGVETERDSAKSSSDMRGCYLLLYRRDTDLESDKMEVQLPQRANVIEKRLRIESERLRHSNERSEKYWYKRGQESIARVEKVINDLKIVTGDMVKKKPQDVTFIPTAMLLDFVEKEYNAVANMINLNKLEDTAAEERKQKRKEARAKEQETLEKKMAKEVKTEMDAGPSEGRRTNGRTRRSTKSESTVSSGASSYIADSSDESDVEDPEPDEAAYAHLYVPEPMGTYEMRICPHNRIPLLNVLQGEIKAVKRSAAERFLKHLNLQVKRKHLDSTEGAVVEYTNSHMMSAQDLCIDCAYDLKKEAVFSDSLDQIEPVLNEILRDQARTVAHIGAGPAGMRYASRKELSAHKRMALQQHEYKRTLQQQASTSLVFGTQFPEENVPPPPSPVPPRQRKRKLTGTPEEPPVAVPKLEGGPSYKIKTDPTSPLKLKLCLSKPPAFANGHDHHSKHDTKANGVMNGHRGKKNAPVASELSSSEPEEEESESDGGESDPDWNGRETPPGKSRKSYRSVGSPKKKRKLAKKENGEKSPEENEVVAPPQAITFNADIVCGHFGIKHGAKVVKLTEVEWQRIVTPFFDNVHEFTADTSECKQCEEEKHIEYMCHLQNREIIHKINNDICGLLRQLEKRRYRQDQLGSIYSHVICGRFLDAFRVAARSRSTAVNVPPLCQGCLLCEHGQPFVVLDPVGPTVANALPITEDEWTAIANSYRIHFPHHEGDLVEIHLDTNGACVDHCGECYLAYCKREDSKRYQYENGSVFIKMKGDESDDKGPLDRKKRPLTTRRVAARNLFKVNMNSSQTVNDLKVDLYRRYGFTPNDQLLINGECVLENEKTLAESRVAANNEENPLLLIVQSHDDDAREVHRGFQDTALAF